MKRFILNLGERIIAIAVVLGFIASFITAYTQAHVLGKIQGGITAFITFVVTLAVGCAGVIVAAFLIYLIIDIRDELKALNEKLVTQRSNTQS